MIDVQTQIEINAPIEKVAAYALDPDTAPEWYQNIKSIVWKTAKPIMVGSRMDFVANFMGRELAYTYEVVDLVPNERLVMRTADGPFDMETTYEWEPISDNKTLMKLRNRGKPKGFSKLATPFISIAMKRANQKDLKSIRSLLEKE